MSRGLLIENYRGRPIPRTLGLWLAAAAALSAVLVAVIGGRVRAPGWGATAGSLLVGAAGLVDDLGPPGPRGLANHLRALAAGHVTTGMVKVIVIVGASVVVVALAPSASGAATVAGVLLIAASANVWNGLDVRPGRALKFGLVGMLALVGIDLALMPTLPGIAIGALAALPADLHERAMLGDSGSNLLGFTIGLGLYLVLPDPAIPLAAAAAVALNVVADTITFSRAIDAVPPLRWFDRLGRLPA